MAGMIGGTCNRERSRTVPMIAALGARIHLFVRPEFRERFTALFRDVLACDVRELDFGLPYPILLVAFPDGSAFSAEFSDLAHQPATENPDDANAFRGAWIEFRTGDVPGAQEGLERAGIPSFSHPGSPHRYFAAPGGQVFRLLDLDYRGP
jgi:hypothetical protein